jgi:hypothetical protein
MGGLSYLLIILFLVYYFSILFTVLVLLRVFRVRRPVVGILAINLFAAVCSILIIKTGLFYNINIKTATIYAICSLVLYFISLAFGPIINKEDQPVD